LQERNSVGQTPLHLSCNWPTGIQILFDHGGRAIIDTLDIYGLPAYVYASKFGIFECVELLLEADCCLFPARHGIDHRSTYPLSKALDLGSVQIGKRIIQSLSDRRARLHALLREWMSPSEVEKVTFSDFILDGIPYKRYASLTASGFTVPESLVGPTGGKSVYHIFPLSPDSAQAFYDIGFHDLNLVDDDGLTPLLMVHSRAYPLNGFRLSSWMLERGADLHAKPMVMYEGDYSHHGTAAHFLAKHAGNALAQYVSCGCLHEFNQEIPNLGKYLISISEVDQCQCGCSSNGCYPINLLFKAFCSHMCVRRNEVGTTEVVHWLEDSIPPRDDIGLELFSEIIRYYTFEKLGLRHTCCIATGKTIKLRDPEEILELQEEDRFGLERLEELVQEFETEFNPSTDSLKTFLAGYWLERMTELLEAVDSVDEEEIKQIEEIGVVMNRGEKCAADTSKQ
jgi:hypothetical protein